LSSRAVRGFSNTLAARSNSKCLASITTTRLMSSKGPMPYDDGKWQHNKRTP
jgi:hypothetical protein